MFDLEQELKNLPESPGVYIMHDSDDAVIYVGKAKILKNRVRQYFRGKNRHTPKVRAMVSHISRFEYIVTGSELEALVLECNLIKKYRPKYNILLKDDKGYPYIKINMQRDYPNIEIVRVLKNDGAKYFGPYIGKGTIKSNLDIVQRIFKPPSCTRRFPQDIGRGRPCLNYHINKCFAPCTGGISKEKYREIYAQICDFLDGGHDALIKELKSDMRTAAEKMDYEAAAALRDKIKAISVLDEKQRIINSDRQNDMDVIDAGLYDNKAFVEAFFIRGGKLLGRESYRLDGAEDKGGALLDFVKQFYNGAPYIPPLILLGEAIDEVALIEQWLGSLRGKKVGIRVPERGEKADLMRLAKKNVEQSITNYRAVKLKEEQRHQNGAQLAEILGLERDVQRIEAYDISNISGADNVAGMVVFVDGKPCKKAYRKFKIKSFDGADDYGAMREVIYRRMRNALEEEEMIERGELTPDAAKFLPYPDVIFVDGALGQISAARSMLEETERDIPVFGMVKNDKHKTRGLIGADGTAEIAMSTGMFNFITRIQDEVHRYAIGYHKQRRKISSINSELDNIAGVGEKKRNLLLAGFGSVEKIAELGTEELTAAGLDRKTAENVVKYFTEKRADKRRES